MTLTDLSPRPPGTPIKFCSLGMVVLDEIRLPNGKRLFDVPGGSGLYSTLGARIAVSGTTEPDEIGSVVLAGGDFPDSLKDVLRDWGLSLLFKMDPSRKSTRGLLQYTGPNFKGITFSNLMEEGGGPGRSDEEPPPLCPVRQAEAAADVFAMNREVVDRTFRYTTPPLQPAPADLRGDPNLLTSTAFHFLASPQDLDKFASSLLSLRAADGIPTRPLMVWEPAPVSCTPENRDAHQRAAKLVDVYSPNHREFLAVFETPKSTTASDVAAPKTSGFDPGLIEHHALRLVEAGVGPQGEGVVVIRAAEHGCLVVSRLYPARWFPAFHDADSPKVVDVTGAGNAFLGAFTVVFATTADPTEVVIASSVAASLAIEQIGLPRRAVSQDKTEVWNGVEISSRIEEYRAKLG